MPDLILAIFHHVLIFGLSGGRRWRGFGELT